MTVSLAISALVQELKGHWFKYLRRQGENLTVPLMSKALNPNLLLGCCTTMADPVKQHISLHLSGVCAKYVKIKGRHRTERRDPIKQSHSVQRLSMQCTLLLQWPVLLLPGGTALLPPPCWSLPGHGCTRYPWAFPLSAPPAWNGNHNRARYCIHEPGYNLSLTHAVLHISYIQLIDTLWKIVHFLGWINTPLGVFCLRGNTLLLHHSPHAQWAPHSLHGRM